MSIKAKIRRFQRKQPLRVLDLFAGCGGLSLGFLAGGFNILAAIECDPTAAMSHARNFYKHISASLYKERSKPRDILEIEPAELISELKIRENPETAVDVLIGGPPCQAFARVGRAKLREIIEHPKAFRLDPRGNLYLRYLHYVRKLKPLALLMENVPDVLNYGGHNISEEVCEVLESEGYDCRYTLLNAAYYGVPQMRERMFLMAYRKEFCAKIEFPAPTHWLTLPPGYNGSRSVALKVVRKNEFEQSQISDHRSFYLEPPQSVPHLNPAITTEAALRDLPLFTSHLNNGMKRGARRFLDMMPYRGDVDPSDYGVLMRNWPRFENPQGISDHVIRYLPRDYRIFAKMKPGDQYPEALCLAQELCEKERIRLHLTAGSKQHQELILKWVPPYDPEKFPNKWRKLEPDMPSRTLMAHIGKDTYSHIHYDSRQARTISVREAARLQSFPDGFIFEGTMNSAFRQIGNAVPPLLAKALAICMKKTMEEQLLDRKQRSDRRKTRDKKRPMRERFQP